MKFLLFLVLIVLQSISFASSDSTSTLNSVPTAPVNSGALTLLRMTPEDTPTDNNGVESLRQITFTFDRDVVPLGRMERTALEVPIFITPNVKCEWRWLSRNTLSCQLDEANQLKEATKYTVLINPLLKTENGIKMSAAVTKTITTVLPKLNYVSFQSWKAPDVPVLRLMFNQAVSKSSVLKAVHFNTPGTFNVFADETLQEQPLFLPLPGEPLVLINKELLNKGLMNNMQGILNKGDDLFKVSRGEEYRRNWLIQPMQGLGLDKNIQLSVVPGLVSFYGSLTNSQNEIVYNVDTFPPFAFLGVRCYPSSATADKVKNLKSPAQDDGSVVISTDDSLHVQPQCDPLRSVGLLFSTPVISDEIKHTMTLLPDLLGGRKDVDVWENAYDYSQLDEPHRKDKTYTVWFPQFLQAKKEYHLTLDHKKLRDEFGSYLSNDSILGSLLDSAIRLDFATDHREAKYHLPHDNVVLEANVDSEQPIIVNNLTGLNLNFSRLTVDGHAKNLHKSISIPNAMDIAYRFPLGIRSLLDGKSGVVTGQFSTQPLIPANYCDNCFFSQVTPWQVHAKIGHFNSLVWVVDFATGKPIADAKVELFLSLKDNVTDVQNTISTSKTNKEGIAQFAGRKTVDPLLQIDNSVIWYVKVSKGNDMALLPLSYDYRVNGDYGNYMPYDDEDDTITYPNKRPQFHHIHSWGATAQGIYRIGDTMQYKIYVRDQDNKKFVPAPNGTYELSIIDPKGNVVDTQKNIRLNEFGAFNAEFAINSSAAVGWYQFQLAANFTDLTWQPLKVLVADFTPAPFQVSQELSGALFQPNDALTITSHANLQAGGPYVDAKTRVTVNLNPTYLRIKDHELSQFNFDSYSEGSAGERGSIVVNQIQSQLDSKGTLTNTVIMPDTDIILGQLNIETAVRDDRGKFVVSQSNASYLGRDRFIGLKMSNWYLKKAESSAISWVVVDVKGKPTAGSKVTINIEYDEVTAARVKGAGNAYLTQFQHVWKPVTHCTVTSTQKIETCNFTPALAGSYRIKGTVLDTRNKTQSTTIETHVSGSGYVLWEQPTDESLQLVPMQDTYKVGQVAKFLVKNPFPNGRALITIERYGVMRYIEQVWSSSAPIVEIPIEIDDVPGFYLSMMVMSPRVEKPIKDGVVDLGKPSFKIAYRQVNVVDPAKQLNVKVTSDKEIYKPRDMAKFQLSVLDNLQLIPGEKQEIAVAILDESVFDLLQGGNINFDPYKGFNFLDGRDLENYSLITRLVGRQNFPKKGANPGGDGGFSLDMRTVFKYVSYWNPSLITDVNGKASFEVEMPDNLTGWRVLAMATTPTDRMGLGVYSFKVNKSIELRPVMPNQITEGDSFQAGFTVMNRTDETRTLTIKLSSDGAVDTPQNTTVTLEAKPFARETAWLPVVSKGAGKIIVTANAVDVNNSNESDALRYEVPVKQYRSLVTVANYSTVDASPRAEVVEPFVVPFDVPKDIYTDVGSFSMVVSPSVIGNIDGAFDYIRDYPYWCWEQRLSKAVIAAQYKKLKPYLNVTDWNEAEKLPQSMLNDAALFQAPNGGMAFWLGKNEYVSPYLSAYTLLAFNWLRQENYSIPSDVEKKLKTYLQNSLREITFPSFYSHGMTSSVRAVTLAALAQNNEISLTDLQRYQTAVDGMDLFGKAYYLQAAMRINGTEEIIKSTLQKILAQSTQSGGKFQFNEKWDDSYSQLLATPIRANCAILESLVYLAEQPQFATTFAPLIGDIPFKLVRSITQSRGAKTYFQNTQENVFCLNSIISFSKVYEATKPNMTIKVSLNGSAMGENKFTDVKDASVTHTRLINAEDVGKRREMTLQKQGEGRVYYSSRLQYAPKSVNAESVNAGMAVTREYSVEREGKWQLLVSPFSIKRGELVRVDLYISLPTSRNFVVVNDPVPGGLEPVNRDLATSSLVDADKSVFVAATNSWYLHYSDWQYYGNSYSSFYHKELRHDSARFYADYLGAGNYHLSYTAQAIAEGHFSLQPTTAEEMYDPDVFGKSKPGECDVISDK